MDVFSVEGEMGLAQDSDLWTVQFWNATSEEYEDSISVSSASATATLRQS